MNQEAQGKKIHPIIMYPYSHPKKLDDLQVLYGKIGDLIEQKKEKYARPLTIVNRQTYYRNNEKPETGFCEIYELASKHSEIVNAWSVDTCQMWLTGFGRAFDSSSNTSDVYWLIPGDFNYASDAGKKVLDRYEEIPDAVYSGKAELCIGEIQVAPNSSKQLIDTYGTYGLLYNWFPDEAKGLRENGIDKPRSEFLAINHLFLKVAMVDSKWFAYEETIVLLLLAMRGSKVARPIKKVTLGDIEDPPGSRDNLANAMQQVERTERVLKVFWRENKIDNENSNWIKDFRDRDHQSEQIRNAAMIILKSTLEENR